jgi:phospholipid transport system transporter-binding protein
VDAGAPVGATLVAAGAGRFSLSGPVGFRTARDLMATGTCLSTGGPVVVDLSGVTAGDSAGLAVLLCWLAEARAAGRSLRFENLPAQLRALARISDVEGLLDRGV